MEHRCARLLKIQPAPATLEAEARGTSPGSSDRRGPSKGEGRLPRRRTRGRCSSGLRRSGTRRPLLQLHAVGGVVPTHHPVELQKPKSTDPHWTLVLCLLDGGQRWKRWSERAPAKAPITVGGQQFNSQGVPKDRKPQCGTIRKHRKTDVSVRGSTGQGEEAELRGLLRKRSSRQTRPCQAGLSP